MRFARETLLGRRSPQGLYPTAHPPNCKFHLHEPRVLPASARACAPSCAAAHTASRRQVAHHWGPNERGPHCPWCSLDDVVAGGCWRSRWRLLAFGVSWRFLEEERPSLDMRMGTVRLRLVETSLYPPPPPRSCFSSKATMPGNAAARSCDTFGAPEPLALCCVVGELSPNFSVVGTALETWEGTQGTCEQGQRPHSHLPKIRFSSVC